MKKRFIAGAIDFLISAMIQAVLMMLLVMMPMMMAQMNGSLDPDSMVIRVVSISYLSLVYLLIRDLLGTKSLGKRTQKLQIVDRETGKEASLLQRLLRNVTWVMGPVEIIVLLVAKKRLGDMLAKTEVKEL